MIINVSSTDDEFLVSYVQKLHLQH